MEEKKHPFQAINSFYHKCARVFRVARKPSSFEVKQISRISALGILIIGAVGFIIGLIFTLFFL